MKESPKNDIWGVKKATIRSLLIGVLDDCDQTIDLF